MKSKIWYPGAPNPLFRVFIRHALTTDYKFCFHYTGLSNKPWPYLESLTKIGLIQTFDNIICVTKIVDYNIIWFCILLYYYYNFLNRHQKQILCACRFKTPKNRTHNIKPIRTFLQNLIFWHINQATMFFWYFQFLNELVLLLWWCAYI